MRAVRWFEGLEGFFYLEGRLLITIGFSLFFFFFFFSFFFATV